jgi:hypothetical protein
MRLEVDSQNQLKEAREMPGVNPAVGITARIVSVIFHPVFIPVYIIIFLLYVHPHVFAGYNKWNKTIVLLQSISMFTFFPLVTVLLLKALKFINTIYLYTRKDRIIPYAACMIWYFWIFYVWRNLPDFPRAAIVLAMGIFIGSIAGLMGNIYIKVSMHAIATGAALAFMFLLAFWGTVNFGVYLSIAIFITGLVLTSRMLVSDHTSKEIYVGLVLGIISMVLASLLATRFI